MYGLVVKNFGPWNSTYVVLILKTQNLLKVNQFRRMSLCDTLYKVVIRILVGRLEEVILRLVSEEQAAFIPGRAISDDIFCAQELTHLLKTAKREDGLVMAKLDMERGYNALIGLSLAEFLEAWDLMKPGSVG